MLNIVDALLCLHKKKNVYHQGRWFICSYRYAIIHQRFVDVGVIDVLPRNIVISKAGANRYRATLVDFGQAIHYVSDEENVPTVPVSKLLLDLMYSRKHVSQVLDILESTPGVLDSYERNADRYEGKEVVNVYLDGYSTATYNTNRQRRFEGQRLDRIGLGVTMAATLGRALAMKSDWKAIISYLLIDNRSEGLDSEKLAKVGKALREKLKRMMIYSTIDHKGSSAAHGFPVMFPPFAKQVHHSLSLW